MAKLVRRYSVNARAFIETCTSSAWSKEVWDETVILLSIDFTLHKILGERMIILHASTMRDSYPKLTWCSGLLALVAITMGK